MPIFRHLFTAALIAAAHALSAAPHAVAETAFPVTIDHAFGRTVIEAKPRRIVAWGWGAQDALIALDEIPIAMPFMAYGGGTAGILPWTRHALEARKAAMPTVLRRGGELPIEQIAALAPDLIVAVYSGISEQEYRVLSRIAPVVAYPDRPWTTSWQDTVRITGRAVGKTDAAERLVAELEAFMKAEAARYPEIAGKTFAAILDFNGATGFYTRLDPRVTMLETVGLVSAPIVAGLKSPDSFWVSLSYETVDRIESDILIGYFDDADAAAAFFAMPTIALLPQLRRGAAAKVIGAPQVAAIAPGSALSIRWGFPDYLRLIAAAARKAR